jgi:hypothetical protein
VRVLCARSRWFKSSHPDYLSGIKEEAMTQEQQAAFVFSQTVCALADVLGMMSENMQRAVCNQSMAYDAKAFVDAVAHIGHNNVLSLFNE